MVGWASSELSWYERRLRACRRAESHSFEPRLTHYFLMGQNKKKSLAIFKRMKFQELKQNLKQTYIIIYFILTPNYYDLEE